MELEILAHVVQAVAAVAYGDDEVLADEDVDLAEATSSASASQRAVFSTRKSESP